LYFFKATAGSVSRGSPTHQFSQRVSARRGGSQRGAMASLVQLELDEKDKENFQELQTSISDAQRELNTINQKIRTRNAEAKHAALTLAEIDPLADDTRAFEQVGKMFLLQPMAGLKKKLEDQVEAGDKEIAALNEKKKHVEEAHAKVKEDFEEFVKAHMVETKGEEEKKE